MLFTSAGDRVRGFAATKWGSTPPRDPVVASWFPRESSSGQNVDEHTALNFSAVYCATYLISSAMGALPFMVYERKPKDERELSREHDLYPLIHDQANPEMTAMTAIQTMVAHALLWHGAYAEIERNGRGLPVAYWPIEPNRVTAKRSASGALYYEVSRRNGGCDELGPEDVLTFGNLGFDGVTGYSIVGLAREAIGLGLAAEQFGASFYGSGAVPSGAIEHPEKGELDPASVKRLREQWNARHSGRLSVAILPPGMKYSKIGVDPEEAQFLSTREFSIEEIARWFNIPPHMLKDLRRATYSNIEHQGIEFLRYTLVPWMKRIEGEFNRKLLSTRDRKKFFAEFNADGVLRGDALARSQANQIQWMNGALTLNEWRKQENRNRLDVGGDDHFVPLNMTTVEQLVSAPQPASPPTAAVPAKPVDEPAGENKDDLPKEPAKDEADIEAARNAKQAAIMAAHGPVFADVFGRMRTKEANAIERASKKPPAELEAWLGTFAETHAATFRGALIPAIDALVGSLRAACGLEVSDEVVAQATADGVRRYVDTVITIARRDRITGSAADVADEAEMWMGQLCERIGACVTQKS